MLFHVAKLKREIMFFQRVFKPQTNGSHLESVLLFSFFFFFQSAKTPDESITLNLFLTDAVYNMCGMVFMT